MTNALDLASDVRI